MPRPASNPLKTLAPRCSSFRSALWSRSCSCLWHNRGFWLPKALPNREEGEPAAFTNRAERVQGRGHHRFGATSHSSIAHGEDQYGLARFFPEATPVRIPVQFTRSNQTSNGNAGGHGPAESTVIEFGTSREVLFACTAPLEFADVLRLRNSDGSLDTEASVVAVQYHPGTTIVAARFLTSVPNWIVKP